ncbi:hypothetical protein Daesc_003935 [Daldinia eschscholtzii]|uniref:Cytochrome P450 n=1 Tax=Daldinia eschscholtzii TaxID=292717 RepID=A0AAX6MNE5_9PEZI
MSEQGGWMAVGLFDRAGKGSIRTLPKLDSESPKSTENVSRPSMSAIRKIHREIFLDIAEYSGLRLSYDSDSLDAFKGIMQMHRARAQNTVNIFSNSQSPFHERLYLPFTSTFLSAYPSDIWIAILALGVPWVIYQAILALSRESQLPANAPPLWKPDHLPFIGAIRFFTGRTDMYLEAVSAHSQKGPRSGNFSFFLGKRHVVGLGVSAEERSNFFENRKMSLMQGTAELLTGLPLTQDIERFSKYFVSSLVTILSREKFVRNLHRLTDDTRKMCLDLLKKDLIRPINDGNEESEETDDEQWRVMNPFDGMLFLPMP